MTSTYIGNGNGTGESSPSIPFKVVDAGRDVRMGLTANSMTELVERVKLKFDIDEELSIKIVLEQDGTEIDDNDYFITLEPDTSLMVLRQQERWTPYKSMMSLGLALEPHSDDDILERLNGSINFGGGGGGGGGGGLNGGGGGYGGGSGGSGGGSTPSSPVEELVWRLHQDLSLFPWLTPKELDTIAKMDTEEMKKNIPDVRFLEFLQDLSERYLQDKGGVRDVHTILKSSSSSTSGSSGSGYSSSGAGSASVSPSASGGNHHHTHHIQIQHNHHSVHGGSNTPNGNGNGKGSTPTTTNTVLHDPIKLIRMYSKSNHYLYNPLPNPTSNTTSTTTTGTTMGGKYCLQNGRDLSGAGEKPTKLHVEPKAFRSQ